MNRSPSKSTRKAPSPRTASEIERLLAARVGAEVHHRRVELDELQVAQGRAGPQGERHAVAGRHRRVGGLGEHLAEAAGGEHDGPAVHRADAVADALADHVQGHPRDAAVLGEQQVDGEGVLDHLDLGRPLDGGDQRPLDLRAGGVAAGVRDPVAVVATLPGQRQLAVGAVVEVGAERDQLADRLGALLDEDPHRVEVAGTGAGHEGVELVLLGGVPRPERGGDAALRPLRGAGGEDVLGDDQHLVATRSAERLLEPERGGEPGDAGADDDDVGGRRPAGVGRG